MPLSLLLSSSSSNTENCKVCNYPVAKYHFGATTCRACAAFFRRFVNSNNKNISCSCWTSKNQFQICRLCRMKKCVAVGMNKCGVGAPKTKLAIKESVSLPTTIQLRDFDRIIQLKNIYDVLKFEREDVQVAFRAPHKYSVRRIASKWESDAQTMWRICVGAFPELKDLPDTASEVLLYNFYPKWAGFNAALTVIGSTADVHSFSPPPIETFYEPDEPSRIIKTPVLLRSVFAPYFKYFTSNVLGPLFEVELDEMEVAALMALLFMDSGYTNLSEKVHDLCRDFGKIVRNQLIEYYKEIGKQVKRLFDVLDVLLIIERLEGKIHEELLMCDAHGITLDKGCLKILSISKL